jgi:putative ABC transport system substrate-binding protein
LWQGLRDLGYEDGQNILIEYRLGPDERLPDLATELARLGVEAIVAGGTPATRAAYDATPAVPVITVASGLDLVALRWVASPAHPGGHLTGFSTTLQAAGLNAKRLELLTETVPAASRVAVLWDAATFGEYPRRFLSDAARTVRVQLLPLELRGPDDLDRVFGEAISGQADSLWSTGSPLLEMHRRRIAELAVERGLPTMFHFRTYVEAGGLMSYGPNGPAMYRRAARYVDKILNGAQPADLPVEQPREFEFVINLKTAQALGLTIPPHVLLQATEVIQ